jgi:hypothetical protein
MVMLVRYLGLYGIFISVCINRNREKNKRGKKSDWHVKLCLVEQNYPSQDQKTDVPGFSPRYFTIWGRNMDTKHTTGEQITGN